MTDPGLRDGQGRAGVGCAQSVEVLVTEGVTDPGFFEKVMARA